MKPDKKPGKKKISVKLSCVIVSFTTQAVTISVPLCFMPSNNRHLAEYEGNWS